MHKLLEISSDTTGFPWHQRTLSAGISTIATMALCLAVGSFTGHESAGAIAAGAAFVVGFAVFHETLASTLLTMGLLTLGIASATLAGSFGAGYTGVVLLLVVVAAVNYGVLSSLSDTAGWMGQQCAIFVIVSSYFPFGVRDAAGRAGMVLLGGGLQMLAHAALDLFENRDTPPPAFPLQARLRARIRELWTQLRNELTFTGDTASYTLRMTLTLLLCTVLYRHFHVRNGYWLPMTALLVLKPQWADTLNRGMARLIGTVAGAAVATLLAIYMPLPNELIFVLVLAAAWACYAFSSVNYALFSLFITLYIVFLFRFGGFSQTSAAHIRLYNTVFGGTIALLMDAVWMLFAGRRRSWISPETPAGQG